MKRKWVLLRPTLILDMAYLLNDSIWVLHPWLRALNSRHPLLHSPLPKQVHTVIGDDCTETAVLPMEGRTGILRRANTNPFTRSAP
ncbi:hypothetical protein AVEN_106343-1 [Araneus ventricosus]|uniref:Uncharacterized protein n=1 Tax=Araneus ventricosus TaxID=182803 RepID=A0A4Y2AUN2_ARAVE|nr:hypothetical protein AVEN_106343-1 [Araneus ventricosus]